jgi:cytochrome c oxidase subunit 3
MTAGPAVSIQTSRVGMCLALAGIGMLFLAFTSAYVVRQGLDPAWQPLRMPGILVANTLVLLASSAFLEKARRDRMGNAWLKATLALGLLFVAGQLTAWRQLAARGIYLDTSPHSSFFYLLTALHGIHVMGGMVALGAAPFLTKLRRRRWLEIAALYWHFMAVLWLYLLFLLFGMR